MFHELFLGCPGIGGRRETQPQTRRTRLSQINAFYDSPTRFFPAAADRLPQPNRRATSSPNGLFAALGDNTGSVSSLPRATEPDGLENRRGICPDAALYIRLAQALEAGDYKLGLYEMHLNTFPAILMLMHRVGLGWEVAGHVWNVVIASLVVLPLYGWIRRQFDHRAAVAGSLLYAVHPKLIEWSPEIIRDPTFWFLFTLSLYLVYRAITEVQLTLFLAAGISMALTWLTRFEGFFLLIPLVLWTFWRFWALRVSRARLLLGAALAVAAFPTLLLMVNLTWLRDYHHFEVSRLKPLNLLLVWLTTLTEGRSPTDAAAGLGGMSVGRIVREFFPVMTRGMSPAFALCTFGGMWGWRRVWARRDHQAIFCMAMAILGGIWIGLWYVHFSCTRYALSIVLLSAGFAALGYRGFTAWLVRTVARLGGRSGCSALRRSFHFSFCACSPPSTFG